MITQTGYIWLMELDVVSFLENSDKAAESAEQDQTAHICSLILLYTLRKINESAKGRKRVKCVQISLSAMSNIHVLLLYPAK